jgi:probable O-glycosylation ligase (exosortase A-associated)
MRDLIIGLLILAPMLMALRHPWIGALGWTWISTMNPHAYSWRVSSMPVAAAMAGATFIGLLISSDKKRFFITRETFVLMLFMTWITITLPFSFYVDNSAEMWNRVIKIDFMILVTLIVIHSHKHLVAFVWVVAGSLAFYGVKGGLFTLATGGSYRVWGPDNSYIAGNNEIALALAMIIPLLWFLRGTLVKPWPRRAMVAAMALCAIASLGSQSRGALLAIGAMFTMFWFRGRHKLVTGVVLVVLSIAVLVFMPDSWTQRMGTIKTYDQDASAMGRINAWHMAFNLAKSNLFGGGFEIYTQKIFNMYAPDPTDVHAAHSIYFMVLGEQGFIGLFLFLLLWALTWGSTRKMMREGRKQPETKWLADLGAMIQASFVGYFVGGAFLSLSYYDLPYNLMVMVIVGCKYLERKEWLNEPAANVLPVADGPLAGAGAMKT